MFKANAADYVATFVAEILGRAPGKRPLIFGLNGPQGSGKTTATAAAVALLRNQNSLHGITVSIDDFYLTRAEQMLLAQRHPQNPYLQQRGYPGTHDISLGCETLSKLKAINDVPEPVALPRYDKSAHDGEGDRLPHSEWPIVTTPLDFVILEGWCLGFTPVPENQISEKSLTEINQLLRAYAKWHVYFDAFIQLKASDIRYTIDWRIEAEQKMRAQGKAGMSDERIRAYIEKFMPSYDLFSPGLDEFMRQGLPRLVIEIQRDRTPLYPLSKSPGVTRAGH